MRLQSIAAVAVTAALMTPQVAWAAPPATRGTGAPRAPTVKPSSTAPPKDDAKDDAREDDGGGRGGGTSRGGGDDSGGGELTGDEGGPTGHNRCNKQPRGAKFRITLAKEAELDDLVNWMMGVSCQKFIWDPKVRGGKVTILSP